MKYEKLNILKEESPEGFPEGFRGWGVDKYRVGLKKWLHEGHRGSKNEWRK